MRLPEIVIVDPVGDLGAGAAKIEEQGLVEQLIAHPAIDGEDGPAPSAPAICWRWTNQLTASSSPMEVATIGLDVSKHVFHIHAVDGQGQVACRQRLRPGEIVSFFSSLVPCLVGIEACATAHNRAREIRQLDTM